MLALHCSPYVDIVSNVLMHLFMYKSKYSGCLLHFQSIQQNYFCLSLWPVVTRGSRLLVYMWAPVVLFQASPPVLGHSFPCPSRDLAVRWLVPGQHVYTFDPLCVCLPAAWTPSQEEPRYHCAGARLPQAAERISSLDTLLLIQPPFRLRESATPGRAPAAASKRRSEAMTSPETHS